MWAVPIATWTPLIVGCCGHDTYRVTFFGRFRWIRFRFGLTSSSEIFQELLVLKLGNLEGVACAVDDTLAYDRTSRRNP